MLVTETLVNLSIIIIIISLSYFSPFHINTQLYFFFNFTKCPAAVIFDDRKSLSIAFLSISYQYAIYFKNFTKWSAVAIFDDQKSPLIAFFSPFQIVLFFWEILSQNGCRRPFWMTENHFRSPFQINMQLIFLIFFSENGRRWPFWMTENHF